MSLDEVFRFFNVQSDAELGEALGIHGNNIGRWRARGGIPAKRQLQIQELTGHKLKADFQDIPIKGARE